MDGFWPVTRVARGLYYLTFLCVTCLRTSLTRDSLPLGIAFVYLAYPTRCKCLFDVRRIPSLFYCVWEKKIKRHGWRLMNASRGRR